MLPVTSTALARMTRFGFLFVPNVRRDVLTRLEASVKFEALNYDRRLRHVMVLHELRQIFVSDLRERVDF